MNRLICALSVFVLVIALAGWDFSKQADAEFGDQHFKTVIALIELHKVRNGIYPEQLKDLRFIGGWDVIALDSVEYKRLGKGYELNLIRGWVAKPKLTYPPEFWRGLGLQKSNLKPSQQSGLTSP